jgi:hypothetical protein
MKYLDKIKRGGKIGGITYYGTVQNGLAHGQGTMIFNGSRKFKGSFNNGKCVGFGFIDGVPVYDNGNLIKGDYIRSYYGNVNDECLPHGVGHLLLKKLKISYIGEFMNGKYHGFGELSVNDTKTRGNFEHGEVVVSYSVNALGNEILKYLEQLNEMRKKEKIVCDSCDKYEGEYPTGKGIMKFKNGDTYIGDHPTGKGVLTFKNGDTYIGKYPTGKGTMNFKNGDVYEGEYPTGKGTIKFKNGKKHEVKLTNGKRNMSFPHEKTVNSEQVDERRVDEKRVDEKRVDEKRVDEKRVDEKRVDEKKVDEIKEELKKIQIDKSNYHLMKELTSLLQRKELTDEDLNQAEELLKSIQALKQSSRSFGMKELAGVAGVAGLSYYLYNKFKKSSKRRVKSSSSKSLSRKSSRRSKESEQSSYS